MLKRELKTKHDLQKIIDSGDGIVKLILHRRTYKRKNFLIKDKQNRTKRKVRHTSRESTLKRKVQGK